MPDGRVGIHNLSMTCETCDNFSPYGDGRIGECRAHPPIMASRDGTLGKFPGVSADFWCGEWKWRTNPADLGGNGGDTSS